MNFKTITQEVNFSAVRSRGPGGQNVNKVSSAAFLTWDYGSSQGLNEHEKQLVGLKLSSQINSDNLLYLKSDEYRDLPRNKARALEKLENILKQAFHIPKKRKATKPTHSSKTKRLEKKSRRGEVKKMRAKVEY